MCKVFKTLYVQKKRFLNFLPEPRFELLVFDAVVLGATDYATKHRYLRYTYTLRYTL